MIFDRNEQKQVVALLGAGSMGTAIVRCIGAGKKILLGDISEKALERVGDDAHVGTYHHPVVDGDAASRHAGQRVVHEHAFANLHLTGKVNL